MSRGNKGQSDALRHMAKTPIELFVGEQKFKLAPLELRQIAELDEWAENAPFDRLRRTFQKNGDILTEEQKNRLVDEAGRLASDPYNRALETGSALGALKAIRLSLSIHNPSLNDKQFDDILAAYPVSALQTMLKDMADTGTGKKNEDNKDAEKK